MEREGRKIFPRPIQILLWILGVTLVIEILGRRFDFSFFETYLNAFRSTGFVFCTAWMLLRWKKETERIFLQKDRHHRNIETGFVQMIGKLVTVTVVLIGLMIVLQIWGLDILPLVAFGGIGAAAIGFAAKDVISNFFGGFMLHLNRPFVVGDHVLLPGKNLEGVVEEIGWNLTMIRDREKRPTYVPSALFSQELVINFSRMSHRRLHRTDQHRRLCLWKTPRIDRGYKKSDRHPSRYRSTPTDHRRPRIVPRKSAHTPHRYLHPPDSLRKIHASQTRSALPHLRRAQKIRSSCFYPEPRHLHSLGNHSVIAGYYTPPKWTQKLAVGTHESVGIRCS